MLTEKSQIKISEKTMPNTIQSILEKLTPVFCDLFDDEELVINEITTAQDVEGWDSLAHIRLMLSIEKSFKIRFTAAEISNFKDVGAMAELILRKQATS